MNKGTLSAMVVGVLIIVAAGVILFAKPSTSSAPTQNTDGGSMALHDKVKVASPASGATVGKSFTVTGEAPGNWFFEASFPVEVLDKDGNKIGQGIAQTSDEWMTVEQISFSADVTISSDYKGEATLVLIRDNPSDLRENDDSLSLPIVIQ